MDKQTSVRSFHEKHSFAIAVEVQEDTSFDGEQALRSVVSPLRMCEDILRPTVVGDIRAARMHLLIEEVRELVEALLEGNLINVADAITDIDYVNVGNAVTWALPLQLLFAEVHASNMTKEVGGHKPSKGSNFVEPDISGVLKQSGRSPR